MFQNECWWNQSSKFNQLKVSELTESIWLSVRRPIQLADVDILQPTKAGGFSDVLKGMSGQLQSGRPELPGGKTGVAHLGGQLRLLPQAAAWRGTPFSARPPLFILSPPQFGKVRGGQKFGGVERAELEPWGGGGGLEAGASSRKEVQHLARHPGVRLPWPGSDIPAPDIEPKKPRSPN